mmetsp:Transcript_3666/g.8118  ORF Transcript_3666/g.8118 Transcript_3666/m.8118 type:complete len:177 (+) Transcript_3666:99-629(+)
MNVHSNLIVDFPSRQRVGSTTTSTSSHISPSSHSPSTLTRPRVSFSEVIRVQTVPKLSKYQQDLWFTADEIKAFKARPKLMHRALKANGLTLAQFAEENIDNTAAFLGLDNFLTEATLHEVISRRKMLFREVLREQRRQMETGAYDADRLATVSEHNSSWSTSRAFIIAKIHSVKR